jgi:hypothetical protein
MKQIKMAVMLLATASFFISCDDEKDKSDASGKIKMVLALDMSVNGSEITYLTPVSEKIVNEGGAVSLAGAKEAYVACYVETYRDWLFQVPSMSESVLRRYTRSDDGKLILDGSLRCSSNPSAGVVNMIVISDTKAYASLMLENKIIIFNPSTMEKTGEINLAKSEFGVNGSATPNPAGMIFRDGKIFVGCMQLTNLPLCADGAYIVVIDEVTNIPEKMISDMRASSASFFNNEMFVDEKGDIYVNCWASYGYVPRQTGGFLRIKKGSTEFDPDYFFNITDRTIEGIEGGRLMTAYTSHYVKNGIACIFGTNPAYASQPIDYINDRMVEAFCINLYNKTITKLDFPRSNSYSCSISHIGEIVYFGITSQSDGAGLFTYNYRTGETSSSPVISAPGTVLDVAVFE